MIPAAVRAEHRAPTFFARPLRMLEGEDLFAIGAIFPLAGHGVVLGHFSTSGHIFRTRARSEISLVPQLFAIAV